MEGEASSGRGPTAFETIIHPNQVIFYPSTIYLI